jgi:hypothetical protein
MKQHFGARLVRFCSRYSFLTGAIHGSLEDCDDQTEKCCQTIWVIIGDRGKTFFPLSTAKKWRPMPISSYLESLRQKNGHDLVTLTAFSIAVFDSEEDCFLKKTPKPDLGRCSGYSRKASTMREGFFDRTKEEQALVLPALQTDGYVGRSSKIALGKSVPPRFPRKRSSPRERN